ncbi:hypothetical protein [Streptosporangium carneum]|uniref:Uncharacterized protein n=1 Tax=Streptosporangium carneum TaxID=47481 RepID=A0A9W6I0A2_9ACTN|nr:hypothetical protein [Streptosporangium carneum]GLK09645.1 hypothetical protein GCM10017600_30510 [Streptosporangium carneum]
MISFKGVLVTATLAAFAFVVPATSVAQLTGAEFVGRTPAVTHVLAHNGSSNNGAANGGSVNSGSGGGGGSNRAAHGSHAH